MAKYVLLIAAILAVAFAAPNPEAKADPKAKPDFITTSTSVVTYPAVTSHVVSAPVVTAPVVTAPISYTSYVHNTPYVYRSIPHYQPYQYAAYTPYVSYYPY